MYGHICSAKWKALETDGTRLRAPSMERPAQLSFRRNFLPIDRSSRNLQPVEQFAIHHGENIDFFVFLFYFSQINLPKIRPCWRHLAGASPLLKATPIGTATRNSRPLLWWSCWCCRWCWFMDSHEPVSRATCQLGVCFTRRRRPVSNINRLPSHRLLFHWFVCQCNVTM